MTATLPLEKNRLAVVCRIVGEDDCKRRALERLEKMRNPAFSGTITRVEFIELLERKGFKVVSLRSWNTWVSFRQWLKPDTSHRVASQLYRQLVADRGRNMTGMYPFIERGRLFLMQSWLAVVGKKR